MRKLLTAAGLLLVVLLLADRILAVVSARTVAEQLQLSGELRERPMVSIRGFPFLTQALSGRYERVELTAEDLEGPELRLRLLDVTVRGAQVPLREALFGTIERVPVESLTASAVVGFADLAREAELAEATVEPAGDKIDLTARVTVLGQRFTVVSRSAVTVDRGDLLLTPQSVTVQGGSSDAVNDVLRDRLELRLEVGTLPYGLRLTGVRVTQAGLVLEGRSGPTVLEQP